MPTWRARVGKALIDEVVKEAAAAPVTNCIKCASPGHAPGLASFPGVGIPGTSVDARGQMREAVVSHNDDFGIAIRWGGVDSLAHEAIPMFLRILDRLEEILIASLIAAATLVIFAAVVQRFAVGVPIPLSVLSTAST